MKKPKRRRTPPRRKQVRTPALPAALGISPGDNEAGGMLAGMLRARLALMPSQVAEEYSQLAGKDGLTLAERAKVSVLEDTYAPSRQQIQAAISEVHAAMKQNRKAARQPGT